MRYALIADIHGNQEALKAVLADIRSRGINQTYCLGDIVGYYPNPNECIALIQEHTDGCIAGNHDYAALSRINIKQKFSIYARTAMEWTIDHLSTDSIQFLDSLPLTQEVNGKLLLTHAGPVKPDAWGYLFMEDDDSIRKILKDMKQQICFIAHTHFPSVIAAIDGKVDFLPARKTMLKENGRYIINAGSVGQPRDGDPRSCYAVYDDKEKSISFVRTKYPLGVTQEKVRTSGLPAFLAARLEDGQ